LNPDERRIGGRRGRFAHLLHNLSNTRGAPRAISASTADLAFVPPRRHHC
jgi:hypothetical protein